jgi:hypothetical protein
MMWLLLLLLLLAASCCRPTRGRPLQLRTCLGQRMVFLRRMVSTSLAAGAIALHSLDRLDPCLQIRRLPRKSLARAQAQVFGLVLHLPFLFFFAPPPPPPPSSDQKERRGQACLTTIPYTILPFHFNPIAYQFLLACHFLPTVR